MHFSDNISLLLSDLDPVFRSARFKDRTFSLAELRLPKRPRMGPNSMSEGGPPDNEAASFSSGAQLVDACALSGDELVSWCRDGQALASLTPAPTPSSSGNVFHPELRQFAVRTNVMSPPARILHFMALAGAPAARERRLLRAERPVYPLHSRIASCTRAARVAFGFARTSPVSRWR